MDDMGIITHYIDYYTSKLLKLGCLGYIGDEILPNEIGIMIKYPNWGIRYDSKKPWYKDPYCWWFRNPKEPPGMSKTLQIMGWTTYQVALMDFFHHQYQPTRISRNIIRVLSPPFTCFCYRFFLETSVLNIFGRSWTCGDLADPTGFVSQNLTLKNRHRLAILDVSL